MSKDRASYLHDLILRVNRNNTGIFERNPELIFILNREVSEIIGDSDIYISEFIIAKIKGRIQGKIGHSEITDEIFIKIILNLSVPEIIFKTQEVSISICLLVQIHFIMLLLRFLEKKLERQK